MYVRIVRCNERRNLLATVIRLNYKSVSLLSGIDQYYFQYFHQTKGFFLLNIITFSEYQIRNNVQIYCIDLDRDYNEALNQSN